MPDQDRVKISPALGSGGQPDVFPVIVETGDIIEGVYTGIPGKNRYNTHYGGGGVGETSQCDQGGKCRGHHVQNPVVGSGKGKKELEFFRDYRFIDG